MRDIIVVGTIVFILIILLVYMVGTERNYRTIKSSAQVRVDKSVVQGSCGVLPEMYCQKIKRLDSNRNILVANLDPGVPIFSPFDGVVTIGIPSVKFGNPTIHYIGKVFYIVVSENGQEKDWTKKRKSVLIAYTGVEENGIKNGSVVKRGDILARTGKSNLDINKMFKPYTLVVYYRNDDNLNNTKTKEMFEVSQL